MQDGPVREMHRSLAAGKITPYTQRRHTGRGGGGGEGAPLPVKQLSYRDVPVFQPAVAAMPSLMRAANFSTWKAVRVVKRPLMSGWVRRAVPFWGFTLPP